MTVEEKAYIAVPEVRFDTPKGNVDINEDYRDKWIEGYEQAEKDFGWHSVEESLPSIDEEVIVLTDAPGTAPIYKIGFGHIVDRRYAVDYDGWNTPRVKYWMPCPTIPGSSDM